MKEWIGNLDDSNDDYSSEFSYNIDKKPRKRKNDDFPGKKKNVVIRKIKIKKKKEIWFNKKLLLK